MSRRRSESQWKDYKASASQTSRPAVPSTVARRFHISGLYFVSAWHVNRPLTVPTGTSANALQPEQRRDKLRQEEKKKRRRKKKSLLRRHSYIYISASSLAVCFVRELSIDIWWSHCLSSPTAREALVATEEFKFMRPDLHYVVSQVVYIIHHQWKLVWARHVGFYR